jgi:homoserine kinase
MIRASFEDVVIEPQRQALIPGFQNIRRAAMHAGALGCSISGSGPAMFAWAPEEAAAAVLASMRAAFSAQGLVVDEWIVDLNCPGAHFTQGAR